MDSYSYYTILPGGIIRVDLHRKDANITYISRFTT